MDRDDCLALAQSIGLDPLMTGAGRTTDDTPGGYGPALDRSFAAQAALQEVASVTEILPEYAYGYQVLLTACVYDLVLPTYALLVDTSVDAPLTNAKFSQRYRSLKELRDAAWQDAANYGYGTASNVGGFKVNLDFLEPGDRVPVPAEYA